MGGWVRGVGVGKVNLGLGLNGRVVVNGVGVE